VKRASHPLIWSSVTALACAALWAASPAAQSAPPKPAASSIIDAATWRHIGPASYGGRIDDVEAVEANPHIIFIGAASGGIWKTVNNGITWKPVFDKDGGTQSIGDLAIAPSDSNIIWAGTGEPNGRQSSSWGDGVYKSIDGGETWQNVGLRDSHHIGRVVIHPRNPDIVFVAALGHLWGPNAERGLYRTRDGGKNWQQVLKIDNDTGVVDVAMDPDGRTLYASSYTRRRRAWGFVGGGTASGIHRSLDGGDTWQKLAGGLPTGTIGRIGLDISRSHPNVVYAIVEHKDAGGVYRTDDRGTTWTKQSSLNGRPSYYSQLRVDPINPNKLWQLASPLHVSIDAGKTWRSNDTGVGIHVDHHGMWINPKNPDHIMLGNDGGLYFTYDGSRNWNFIDNLPLGQYYDISVDSRDPYWVYGGTQDNGTWGIAARNHSQLGIMNSDVVNIAYGDGFYTQPDPKDPRTIYANSQSGRAYLVDLDTREEKGIRPVPAEVKEQYRFNWSTPLLISPHDSKVVYYAGNKLFRTADRGQKWEAISPDLTLIKNEEHWKKLPLFGPERSADTLSRDDGVSDFGTITTISESPVKAGVLYAGTDDGQVQMTADGGKSWQNITSRFKLPGARWVSRVLASKHGAGHAYATFDGHQDDDFKPYLFKTTDQGASWTSIAGDMPDGMVINAIEEHPRDKDLLFVGTEFGLFITTNGGRNWMHARGNLPRVPVDDIVFNEAANDLVLGTHGRSIIILDDISMIEHQSAAVLSADAHLFPLRTATQYYEWRLLPVPGAGEFQGSNPPYGALITYVLKDDPPAPPPPAAAAGAAKEGAKEPAKEPVKKPTVKITILGPDGKVVRELEGPDKKGLHRVNWDLRYPLPYTAVEEDESWFGAPKGTFVLPGTYTVKLTTRGKELTQTVQVRVDPRSVTTPEALQTRFKASQSAAELQRSFFESAAVVATLSKELEAANAAIKEREKEKAAVPEAVTSAIKDFTKKVDDLKEKFKAGWGGPKFLIWDLAGQLQASTSMPTEAQLRVIEQMNTRLTTDIATLNTVASKDLPTLQATLRAAGLAPAAAKPVAPPKTQ
jgi:photosystem II stability/assembly factor-like uncharacterized protein